MKYLSGECCRFIFQKCVARNRINVFLWGKGGILCKCQQPERRCYITVVRLEGQSAGAGFARCEHGSQQNRALVAVSRCYSSADICNLH